MEKILMNFKIIKLSTLGNYNTKIPTEERMSLCEFKKKLPEISSYF